MKIYRPFTIHSHAQEVIWGTLSSLARTECVGVRYKEYFIVIPCKSSTIVVTKFSYDISVQKFWWREH